MIRKWLTAHGYTLPEEKWYAQMAVFMTWYQGYDEKFHRYMVYNGQEKVACERFRLNMAGQICAEHATLMLNDRVQIACDGFDELAAILAAQDFFVQGNRLIELAYALGTGALVEYKGADGSPCIDYVRGDMIFPLKWHGATVTDCAFASRVIVGSELGFYLQLHTLEPDGYVIRNVWLNAQGGEASAPEGIESEVHTGSRFPLFQLIRPTKVNRINLDVPMGMSIFGDAIDQLKGCDLVYDSYMNEFVAGRSRIMIPQSLATIQLTKTGAMAPRFDPHDTTFYVYEQSPDGRQDMKHIAPPLRTEELSKGMQDALDLLGVKCDLGRGYFRFESGAVKTAREVIAQNSALYRALKRNEKVIESAIFDMVKALAFLSGKEPEKMLPVITFDETIFDDDDSIIEQNVLLVNSGLRTRRDAIMAIERIDEAAAEQKAEQIRKEQSGDKLDEFPED